jgi:hypothetical protein
MQIRIGKIMFGQKLLNPEYETGRAIYAGRTETITT